ncbi:alpha/beta fold hydrolase [Streptomyces sp. NPDC055992]|uniref:alpha/beta fold hydrolase n=1 Tax=Streptomyces sp. NPDC055992 TaxID=3345673 RepID=UPI0035D86F1E
MSGPTIGTLRVPGATLHYEVRGRGPLLLLIPGGTGGAASFDGVADRLATAYTVAAYDPRGISRSPLDDPGAAQSVAEHADDALRLLELLTPGEPARVFGASSGGIAALRLLAAHPGRLARVVAHEPPVVEVLPDAIEHRAFLDRVRDALRRQGLGPAMALFAAGLAKDDGAPGPEPVPDLPPPALEPTDARVAGLPYFLGRVVPAFMSYAPDIHRLKSASDRLVLAVGRDSYGELPHRAATALAEQLGAEPRTFPGGHLGLTTHPDAFDDALRSALQG